MIGRSQRERRRISSWCQGEHERGLVRGSRWRKHHTKKIQDVLGSYKVPKSLKVLKCAEKESHLERDKV